MGWITCLSVPTGCEGKQNGQGRQTSILQEGRRHTGAHESEYQTYRCRFQQPHSEMGYRPRLVPEYTGIPSEEDPGRRH